MLPLLFAKLNLVFFAEIGDPCNLNDKFFFFLPPWWKYLHGEKDALGHCAPALHAIGDISLIGLAILDMLLRIAGFLAVVSIIIAGARLITSEGSPEKGVAARNRIINSLIGLALAVSATAMVSFLGGYLGGSGASGLPHAADSQASLDKILGIVFVIMGALAFLFMVIAGLRFTLAGSDSNRVASARRQMIYAALGLVVIASAATIVNFVLKGL